jgi:hypothetical protein
MRIGLVILRPVVIKPVSRSQSNAVSNGSLRLQPQLHHRRQPHRAIWTNELKFHLGAALENGVTREASRRSASPMRRSR